MEWEKFSRAGAGNEDISLQEKKIPRRDFLGGAIGIAAAVAVGGWIPAQAAAAVANTGTGPAMKNTPMFAYVGCRTTKERNARGEGIGVYRMDGKTGDWTPVQLVKDLLNPSFLGFDRQQRYLYTVHGDSSEVSAFAIDQQTGELEFLNTQNSGGKNPVHLMPDPSNQFLLVPNYRTATLAVLPINQDGSLEPLCDLVQLTGELGPHKTEQNYLRPHHIPFDRAGSFVVVPDKGGDRVYTFGFDAVSGKLVANHPPFVQVRAGAGPRHVVFHPQKSYAYVLNELDSSITTYSYCSVSGILKPLQIMPMLPTSFTGNSTASEIAIAASGRFVYGSNRGHDSIAIFAVDQTNGLLSPVGWESSQGKTPRFFTLDPSENFLYAANEDSDTIVTFRVNQATGKLTATGQIVKSGSPTCIVFKQA
ncbi:MAG: lactonase family protein [Negativicutes bacterium]|nr:lactonase family protein [Negativicutes bacterium]